MYKSFKIALLINTLFIGLYLVLFYAPHNNKHHDSFMTEISELDHRMTSYFLRIQLIEALWENWEGHDDSEGEFRINFLKPNSAGSAEARLVVYFMNYLQSQGLIKKEEKVYLRNIKTKELISTTPDKHIDSNRVFDLKRCESIGICGSDGKLSYIHNTVINDSPTITLFKKFTDTDFTLLFDINLKDLALFNTSTSFLDPYNGQVNDIKLITLKPFGEGIFPYFTDIISFSMSKLDYLIIERIPLLHILDDIKWLCLLLLLLSWVGIYLFLDLKIKAHLIESKHHKSVSDILTGAYNREFLDEDVHFIPKINHGGTILYIDGDNIKYINDQYGHDFGDTAIKCVYDAIESVVRSSDPIIRMGGDEFVVILIDCDMSVAEQLFSKISSSLSMISKNKLTFLPSGLTITLGLSTFTGKEDLTNSITSADLQMLKNKKGKKNE